LRAAPFSDIRAYDDDFFFSEGDIQLMRQVVGNQIGVKASGGLASYDRVIEMVDAGARRIGTQFGVEILAGCPA
jgi:deoxyribose-phosphate aldolase